MRLWIRHLTLPILIFAGATAWASEFSDSVIRLKRAGLSEPVLQAYVNNAKLGSDAQELTLEEIEELEDAGVPDTVIVAMADRSGTMTDAGAASNTYQASGSQPQYSYEAPAAQAEPASAHAEASVLYAPPSQELNISYFYGSLAPYGEWHRHSSHGWVWTPHVTLQIGNWRPYCNDGRWVWTDFGWYWQSSYPWGWATFHYGRWLQVDARWCWVPDTVWGPAWVHWRHSDDYYGWAPLPPEARFRSGVGFFYREEHVSVGFNFGLTADAYAFVPTHNFLSINLGSFALDRPHVHRVYNRTRIVNNTYIYNDNRVYNQGIPVTQVSAATNTGVRRYVVSEMRVAEGRAISRGEKVTGTTIQVYKPALKNAAPLEPKQAIQRAEVRRSEAVKRSKGGSFSSRDDRNDRDASQRLDATKRALEQRSRGKTKGETQEERSRVQTESESIRGKARGATKEEQSRVQTESEPARGKAHERVRELKDRLKSRTGSINERSEPRERKGNAGAKGRELEQQPRNNNRGSGEKASKSLEELKRRKAEQEMNQETKRKDRIADPEAQPKGRGQLKAQPGQEDSERGDNDASPRSEKRRAKDLTDPEDEGNRKARGKHDKGKDKGQEDK